ncbi:MAG: electron transport complex subunit RsxC [Muribaculaceae bacterium]|nr:electron transport complex subunit RsxC [Muribaculaceae bacterium]
MKTFHKGGIHPNPDKLTADIPTMPVAPPAVCRLMLSQAIGAPAKPMVKPGESVTAGQMVAEAGGFVSAPVHTPVSGTVKKIEPVRNPQGLWQDAIVIETAPGEYPEEQRQSRTIDEVSPKEIIDIVGRAGIVGLGGATFPTRVKLSVPPGKKAEVIVINGAECEPYLTCDDRLMQENPKAIVDGTRLIMKATDCQRAVIGIEENKPLAIEAMRKAVRDIPSITVEVLVKKYPQGSEKQLIEATTGRVVPAGGLPIDAGAIVDNVATAAAVADAVLRGLPMTARIVTVTGPAVSKPGNFLVPLGTPVSTLIELAGGLPEDTGKVIGGGPMMGRAMCDLEAPTTKGLSGVLILPRGMSMRAEAGPCIRCARCVSVCPMGLEPYLLMTLGELGRWEEAKARGAANCLECGCCSYTCPASRPLLDYIRLDKMEIRKL